MFEQALIYRAGVDKIADIGLLAETLFFYGSTQVLFDRDAVKISYVRDNFGVVSAGILREHKFYRLQAAWAG